MASASAPRAARAGTAASDRPDETEDVEEDVLGLFEELEEEEADGDANEDWAAANEFVIAPNAEAASPAGDADKGFPILKGPSGWPRISYVVVSGSYVVTSSRKLSVDSTPSGSCSVDA